jgi:hypothetical protein
MGFFMSFVMVLVINGFTANFLQLWWKAGIRGFCVAFPSAFLVAPIANKITDNIMAKLKKPTPFKRRVIFALVMPAFMDFIIANVSTLTLNGLTKDYLLHFGKAYINGYIVASFLAFFVAPLMMRLAKKIT